jgi:cytochrome c peroxidase
MTGTTPIFHPSEFYGCKRRIAYKYYEAKGSIKNERQDANRVNSGFLTTARDAQPLDTYASGLKTLYGKWKCEACHNIQGVEEKSEYYALKLVAAF